ncbi:MAG TPA: immunoglobulin-like domain-containing protein [Pilimelia sp.]|nr:immunoglobulin-like domain-containing protein [Pilimelia sp.]
MSANSAGRRRPPEETTRRPRTPRQRRRRTLAAAAALLCLVAVPAGAGPARADLADGLALWYKLDAGAGSTALDSSGRGRDGTVHGTADWSAGQGLGFNGTDTYIRVPDNILAGLDAITVSMAVRIDPAQATPYFIYGFGNSAGTGGDGYLFTTGDGYRTSIATGNWATEQTVSAGASLTRGVWKHLTYTLAGGTAVLYEDGGEVGRNTGVTITPGAIGAGVTSANYIGRSVYAGDHRFAGRIRDFRVYDRALPVAEVQELALPISTDLVTADRDALTLGDTTAVTTDLSLPRTGQNGSAIAWTSSDVAVVAGDGTVTRPPVGGPAATVTLTAALSKGAARATRSFTVTVLPRFTDAQAVRADAAALVVHNVGDVRGNLTLPTAGPNGTRVAWSSARPSVVSSTGVVRRPARGDATVRLTATVTKGTASARRTLTAVVRERPVRDRPQAYAFSYFTGEGTANGEQVYFAASRGNDPLHWQELNGGAPTMTSALGERGVRDPFIIRSPEGDKFYLIATDLRIHGNGDWERAQRRGSRSIMVWESVDMVNWSAQRMVEVAPPEAGNTWAPEAFYDTTTGEYVVFWASKIYADAGHTGETHNRMMYATTRDFHTFSAPAVYADPGHSIIDTTMISHGGKVYRFTKDERNNTPTSPNGKFVFGEVGSSVLADDFRLIGAGIGKGDIERGEGPTVFKSNTEEKWYLFIDEFGGRGYVPFETTDLDSGQWRLSADYALPSSPRHGTVLPVTRAEHSRLVQTPPQVCTRTVTGRHAGPLTVTEGVTCLVAATVTGRVTVAAGASLVVTGGRIGGPLDATGAKVVALVDSTVGGPVAITGTTGWVRLAGSAVAGPVFIAGTTGAVAPDLSRSSIAGLLYCHGNARPPDLTGARINGARYGQCAGR